MITVRLTVATDKADRQVIESVSGETYDQLETLAGLADVTLVTSVAGFVFEHRGVLKAVEAWSDRRS